VAYTHVAALEQLTDTSDRYLVSAASYSQQEIVDIVHESSVIPESIKNTTPVGTKGQQMTDHYEIDSSKAQKELHVTYIPLKKTIEDLVLQFVELQETLGSK
jgi:nucleoside-diphosphate-sugar epimerase